MLEMHGNPLDWMVLYKQPDRNNHLQKNVRILLVHCVFERWWWKYDENNVFHVIRVMFKTTHHMHIHFCNSICRLHRVCQCSKLASKMVTLFLVQKKTQLSVWYYFQLQIHYHNCIVSMVCYFQLLNTIKS